MPIPPKINTRNGRLKTLNEATERTGNHQVSGAERYISNSKTAEPTPKSVVPKRINKIQRFTPKPGTNQRKELDIRCLIFNGGNLFFCIPNIDDNRL